jgi:hypothetical protein
VACLALPIVAHSSKYFLNFYPKLLSLSLIIWIWYDLMSYFYALFCKRWTKKVNGSAVMDFDTVSEPFPLSVHCCMGLNLLGFSHSSFYCVPFNFLSPFLFFFFIVCVRKMRVQSKTFCFRDSGFDIS